MPDSSQSTDVTSLKGEVATLRQRVAELQRRLAAFDTHGETRVMGGLEVSLVEREELLAEAERAAHLGTWVWNLEDNRVFWSEELYRILGYDPARDQASVENFFAAIHPEDLERVRASSERARQAGISERTDCRVRRTDGTIRYVTMNGTFLFDETGGPRRVVGTVLDLTETRATERALSEAQRLSAIGRLAGGIAHDFNNLMTVVRSSIELIDQADPRILNEIRSALESGRSLTDQLLAFGRQSTLHPRRVDINEIVSATLRMLERVLGEHITVRTLLGTHLPAVELDAHLTTQALINLLLNARDAMPGGGTVVVRTARAGTGASAAVELSVEDTGPGVGEAARDHIFEPFFTSKPDGVGGGLGLAMVHGAVLQQGGSVSVENVEHGGARFTLRFPPAQVRSASPHPGANSAEAATGAARMRSEDDTPGPEPRALDILVVEDQPAVASAVAALLQRDGHRVLIAQTPSQAIAICGEQGQSLDLILCDLVMPQMHGPALIERLAELGHRPRVLFMSGYGAEASKAVDAEHHEILAKPFSPEALASAIARTLR